LRTGAPSRTSTPRIVAGVALVAVVLFFPWLPGVRESLVINANLAAEYALIAVSLVVLTGWVGQISLAQGSFVGIGAFATGLLIRSAHIAFPVNLPLVAAITAIVATLLGVVALRVRGLYLAVATLIFAYMAQTFLFSQSWLVGEGGASSIAPPRVGRPGTITYFDLARPEMRYVVIVAALAASILAARHIRSSKTGRAFFAVRGSEMAAVSLGIDVTRYKLLAFAISGALAGVAGNLTMIDLRTVTPSGFQFTTSLLYLSIAVVGGITSLGGAVGAGLLFGALNELFLRVTALNGYLEIVSVSLLLVVLLAYPGGLGALGPMLRRRGAGLGERVGSWFAKPLARAAATDRVEREDRTSRARLEVVGRIKGGAAALGKRITGRRTVTRRTIDLARLDLLEPDEPSVEEIIEREASLKPRRDWRTMRQSAGASALPADRASRKPVLEAEGVTVRFGGLVAVGDVTLAVREGEIVGLIGPNGAGKTTTFNAIAGLNSPSRGRIRLFGEDATDYPVHLRAQMGVGRTFQLIQLFPQLSVFDNLLVATHVHNDTGVVSHVLVTERAIAAEVDARRRVRQVVSLLGLEDVVDRPVAGLPFGVLRQVEIARALVTEAPLLMLDEPASGLDNAETDELAKLLRFIRGELGVTILLIEHDVRMVTAVSDYIYVLDRGAMLSEGTPSEIQRDPAVVAAYLGESDSGSGNGPAAEIGA
jgi:ABC-type branched-subunit amino acid transport system ATPase component/ABC-type branched-subunit amino acid transport system permease subunit